MTKTKGVSISEGYSIVGLVAIAMVVFGLFLDPIQEIIRGLYNIIIASDVLITDYFVVGGLGAALVNAGLLMLLSIAILLKLKVPFSGLYMAAIFLMGSFGLFGKNLFNVWPIIFGVALYARVQKEPFKKYIHVAFLGSCLAPFVTEVIFIIGFKPWIAWPLGLLIGVSIGFLLPPVAGHSVKIHQGFALYNVGLAAGLIGGIYASLFKSFGYKAEPRLLWSTGNNTLMATALLGLFACFFLYGFIKSYGSLRGLKEIYSHSGRLGSDFIQEAGLEATLMNMGLNGVLAVVYVLVVQGELNGPTIGGILTIVGFSGYGKHFKNILPVIFGVFIGSTLKTWNINDPAILLAALFGTALAPIAGHYGWVWGVVAGFLNSSLVLYAGFLHGGMNLYNTGFSAGLVAAVMIPILNALHKKRAASLV